MQIPPADTPIVCDLSTARDTATERLAEYQDLFGRFLTAREKSPDGIRFRFRAEDGIEAWVRDLAAREHACCAFMVFDVRTVGNEVYMDVAVSDNDDARAVLDEFYDLPEAVHEDVAALAERYRANGLQFTDVA